MHRFLWFLAVAWSCSVLAEGEGLKSLDRFYSEVESFHARFEQLVLDEERITIDQAKGQVWIERPGRFRWNYAPPDAQEIVGDGEKLWIYDIELEQLTVRDQEQTLGRTPAILLAGKGDYSSAYEVRDGGSEEGIDWVALQPREEESGFTEIRIGFKGGSLEVMELQDALGQTTRITFLEVKTNVSIDDERFRFLPPPDVDIIDESKF